MPLARAVDLKPIDRTEACPAGPARLEKATKHDLELADSHRRRESRHGYLDETNCIFPVFLGAAAATWFLRMKPAIAGTISLRKREPLKTP